MKILLLLISLIVSNCAMLQSDYELPPKNSVKPFSIKENIEIWRDTLHIPFHNIRVIDDMNFLNGKTGIELEKSAVLHAKRKGADGFYVYERFKSFEKQRIDVGKRRGDLNIKGFDLEKHGVKNENLHFGKLVDTEANTFNIRVRFFVYKSRD